MRSFWEFMLFVIFVLPKFALDLVSAYLRSVVCFESGVCSACRYE